MKTLMLAALAALTLAGNAEADSARCPKSDTIGKIARLFAEGEIHHHGWPPAEEMGAEWMYKTFLMPNGLWEGSSPEEIGEWRNAHRDLAYALLYRGAAEREGDCLAISMHHLCEALEGVFRVHSPSYPEYPARNFFGEDVSSTAMERCRQ